MQSGNFTGLFSLLYSGLTIAGFWTLLYAFFGFYVKIFRRSRARELFTLLFICLAGALILMLFLVLDSVFVSA